MHAMHLCDVILCDKPARGLKSDAQRKDVVEAIAALVGCDVVLAKRPRPLAPPTEALLRVVVVVF